jgi:hypothetical protein
MLASLLSHHRVDEDGPSCMAILGGMCISPPLGDTTISIHNVGFGAAGSVEVPGWRANIELRGDVLQRVNSTKLDRACAGGECIGYWRKCDNAQQPTDCRYVLEWGTSIFLTS